MLVSDIITDAKEILGVCSDTQFYSRINHAIELLANKSNWDSMTGYMDICVCNSCVTLPREVETPLGITYNCNPIFGRDRWFEFHLNGTGSHDTKFTGAWDDRGDYAVTFNEPREACQLFAVCDRTEDSGKKIYIEGIDSQGKEIYYDNLGNGTLTKGIYLTCRKPSENMAPTDARIRISKITRLDKPETAGFIRLYASYIDSIVVSGSTGTVDTALIGWYYPDDTLPKYRRIKLGRGCGEAVRMIYRRKFRKVKTEADYIPLDNTMALLQALRSVDLRFKNRMADAVIAEADAVKLASEEQATRNMRNGVHQQIHTIGTINENDNLWS